MNHGPIKTPCVPKIQLVVSCHVTNHYWMFRQNQLVTFSYVAKRTSNIFTAAAIHHLNLSGINLQVGKPQENVNFKLKLINTTNHLLSDKDPCGWPMRRFLFFSSFYIGNPKNCEHKKYKKTIKKGPYQHKTWQKKIPPKKSRKEK